MTYITFFSRYNYRFLCEWGFFVMPMYLHLGNMWRFTFHTLYNNKIVFLSEWGNRPHWYNPTPPSMPLLISLFRNHRSAFICHINCTYIMLWSLFTILVYGIMYLAFFTSFTYSRLWRTNWRFLWNKERPFTLDVVK